MHEPDLRRLLHRWADRARTWSLGWHATPACRLPGRSAGRRLLAAVLPPRARRAFRPDGPPCVDPGSGSPRSASRSPSSGPASPMASCRCTSSASCLKCRSPWRIWRWGLRRTGLCPGRRHATSCGSRHWVGPAHRRVVLAGATDRVPIWLLALAATGIGVGAGQTGSTGVLLDAVPVERIVSAMVVWSRLAIVGYLVGPAVGGPIAATLGFGAVAATAAGRAPSPGGGGGWCQSEAGHRVTRGPVTRRGAARPGPPP